MADKWKRTVVKDNQGKDLEVWVWGEYEAALEYNAGLLGGWLWELQERRRRVGLFNDLPGAQAAAEQRERDREEDFKRRQLDMFAEAAS